MSEKIDYQVAYVDVQKADGTWHSYGKVFAHVTPSGAVIVLTNSGHNTTVLSPLSFKSVDIKPIPYGH